MAVAARILVVDDEPDMVETVARILTHLGHESVTATEGGAALELLERERPDLVLTDLRMPGMDGLALLKEVKRIDPEAPVVLFTAHATIQTAVEAIKEGVDVRTFQIIYELVNAIKAALEGLLEPKIEEVFLGRAEVRRLFQISKVGIVAGCFVTKGVIRRDAMIRIIRGKERLTEARIASLRRVKEDARDVQEGLECGIALEGNIDLQPGDLLESWEQRTVSRNLA
jgi:translation initiation factor IF-2